MPIEALGLKPRLPRIGKIRLGEMAKNSKGKEYPKALDYFSFRDVPELAEMLGEKDCRRIPRIMVPAEKEDDWFPVSWTAYGKSTGIFCRSWDGETATRTYMGDADAQGHAFIKDQGLQVADGEMFDMPCTQEECPYYVKQRCKRLGRLFFFVLDSPVFGVYEISTTSINSMRNVISAARAIKETAGRIAGIPLTLTLEPAQVAPGGRRKTVWVLNLTFEEGGIKKLLQVAESRHIAKLPAASEVREAAARSAAVPEDLYPDGGEDLDQSLGAEEKADHEAHERGDVEYRLADDEPLNTGDEIFAEANEADRAVSEEHKPTGEQVARAVENAEKNRDKPPHGQRRRPTPRPQPQTPTDNVAPERGESGFIDF